MPEFSSKESHSFSSRPGKVLSVTTILQPKNRLGSSSLISPPWTFLLRVRTSGFKIAALNSPAKSRLICQLPGSLPGPNMAYAVKGIRGWKSLCRIKKFRGVRSTNKKLSCWLILGSLPSWYSACTTTLSWPESSGAPRTVCQLSKRQKIHRAWGSLALLNAISLPSEVIPHCIVNTIALFSEVKYCILSSLLYFIKATFAL